MNQYERITEIFRVVDEMLRRIELWITDPYGKHEPAEDIISAIQNCAFICESGNVPDRCEQLAQVEVPKLAESLRAYLAKDPNSRQPNDAPASKFWAACRAVHKARIDATTLLTPRRQSVKSLRGEGVSDMQIASAIYGWRGEGPFMLPDGTPNVDLLDQEADKPGSIVPADWVPEWEKDAHNRRMTEMLSKLDVYEKLINGDAHEDPETIENLLRLGAFVQQIERVKRVTRAEVLTVAKRIGVKAVDGPDYVPTIDELRSLGSADEILDDEMDGANSNSVRNAIIEIWEEHDGNIGAPEIVEQLRQRGLNYGNARSVAAYVAGHKKQLKAAAVN